MGVIAGSDQNPLGTITYNGFVFSGPLFRWTLGLVPQDSRDGRTTIGNRYRLQVRYIMTDDDNGEECNAGVDHAASIIGGRSRLQLVRGRLTKRGGRLTIDGMGFDLDLNDGSPDTLFDPEYGPRCTNCLITPIGDGICFQIDWALEWMLPECDMPDGDGHRGHASGGTDVSPDNPSYLGFPYTLGNLGLSYESLEINYGYTIDYAGLTKRVIQGSFTLALNRDGVVGGDNSTISLIADQLREAITPTVPLNFRRTTQDWRSSPDFRVLSYTIVDEELPSENAYPEGVVEMSLDHTVNVNGTVGLPGNSTVTCSMDGFFETYKGANINEVFKRVVAVIQARLDRARYTFENAAGNGVLNPQQNPVYLTGVSVTESVFGPRRVSFSITYMIVSESRAVTFVNLVSRTGLFQPLLSYDKAAKEFGAPVTDAEAWADSLGTRDDYTNRLGKPWHQRGIAGLTPSAAKFPIVGPCDETVTPQTEDFQLLVPVYANGGSLVTGCPPSGYDYLAWQSELQVEVATGEIAHIPMTTPGVSPDFIDPLESVDKAPLSNTSFLQSEQSSIVERIQHGDTLRFCFVGRALRLGGFAEVPSINKDRLPAHIGGHLYRCNDGTRNEGGRAYISHTRGPMLGTCATFASAWHNCWCFTVSNSTNIREALQAIEDAIIFTSSDPSGKKVGGKSDDPANSPPVTGS